MLWLLLRKMLSDLLLLLWLLLRQRLNELLLLRLAELLLLVRSLAELSLLG